MKELFSRKAITQFMVLDKHYRTHKLAPGSGVSWREPPSNSTASNR